MTTTAATKRPRCRPRRDGIDAGEVLRETDGADIASPVRAEGAVPKVETALHALACWRTPVRRRLEDWFA